MEVPDKRSKGVLHGAQILQPKEGPRHQNVTFAGGFKGFQDKAKVRTRVRADAIPAT